MKATANLTTFTQQPNGLWVCTITSGSEQHSNLQEYTNKGTSPRHAYHRARLLRRRVSKASDYITCACHSCQEWLAESSLTAKDDQVLGTARAYQRPPLPAARTAGTNQ